MILTTAPRILPVVVALLFITGCSSGGSNSSSPIRKIKSGESPADYVAEQFTVFHKTMLTGDEEQRLAVFDSLMAQQSHYQSLLGTEAGDKIWKMLQPRMQEMRNNTDKYQMQHKDSGELQSATAHDIRGEEMFAESLKLIPADVPIFRVTYKEESGAGGISGLAVLDGQVVLLLGFMDIGKALAK